MRLHLEALEDISEVGAVSGGDIIQPTVNNEWETCSEFSQAITEPRMWM